jgi:hypothetical protein
MRLVTNEVRRESLSAITPRCRNELNRIQGVVDHGLTAITTVTHDRLAVPTQKLDHGLTTVITAVTNSRLARPTQADSPRLCAEVGAQPPAAVVICLRGRCHGSTAQCK